MAFVFLRLPSTFPQNDDQVNEDTVFLEIDFDSLSTFFRVSELSSITERKLLKV